MSCSAKTLNLVFTVDIQELLQIYLNIFLETHRFARENVTFCTEQDFSAYVSYIPRRSSVLSDTVFTFPWQR